MNVGFSIGFGAVTEANDGSRLFSIFMILFGGAAASAILVYYVGSWFDRMEQIQKHADAQSLSILGVVSGKQRVDLDGDGFWRRGGVSTTMPVGGRPPLDAGSSTRRGGAVERAPYSTPRDAPREPKRAAAKRRPGQRRVPGHLLRPLPRHDRALPEPAPGGLVYIPLLGGRGHRIWHDRPALEFCAVSVLLHQLHVHGRITSGRLHGRQRPHRFAAGGLRGLLLSGAVSRRIRGAVSIWTNSAHELSAPGLASTRVEETARNGVRAGLVGVPVFAFACGCAADTFLSGIAEGRTPGYTHLSEEEFNAVKNLGVADDYVDFGEFLALELIRQGKLDLDTVQAIHAAFNEIDTDGSGGLDREEVMRFQKVNALRAR